MTAAPSGGLHVVTDVEPTPDSVEIQLAILAELRNLNKMLSPLAEMAKMRMPLSGFKLPGRKA